MPDVETGDTFYDNPGGFYDLTDEDMGEHPDIGRVRFAVAACESCGTETVLRKAPVVCIDNSTDVIAWGAFGRISLRRWRQLVEQGVRVSPGKCGHCGWCGLRAAGLSGDGTYE